ncbi:MAG: mechanosensitive ion channel family protein [Phycisphaerae bacterium]|nr:mechanosensitive ion channel family protein [Phycisphaerae bacterium]
MIHATAATFLAEIAPAADPNAGANTVERVIGTLVTLGIDWGARVLGVLAVLGVAWMLAGWASGSVVRLVSRARVDQTLTGFFANLVRWAVLTLGLVACLSIFGINIAAVTAVIGAAGLAIGLAMQGSLSNMAAGIMLLILRPFNVGDSITVGAQSGTVHDIDLFSTKVDTADNRRLIIPNSTVFGATIENATHHGKRRVDVSVRTPFAANIDEVRAALMRAAANVPQALRGSASEAALTEIGPTGMLWSVRTWVATGDVGSGRDALISAVKTELDAVMVPIPNTA